MDRRPLSSWERDERRNARIRQLREQREAPIRRRRRVQPVLLLAWLAGIIALLGAFIFIGFVTIFAPRLMAWVEANPGSIEHGIVQDFVRWYEPEALSDEPASGDRARITVDIELGSTDTQIGQVLFDEGLVHSPLAFQWAVIQAGRAGTLAAGVYDLSPTLRPSEIVATLQGVETVTTTVTVHEGLRLEEVVAAVGDSELTMNLEEFATLVRTPPASILNQHDFLNDLPADRSLEGYLYPDTYDMDVIWTPEEVLNTLLTRFGQQLTPEIRAGIAAQGLTIDEAVRIASIVEREAVVDAERPLIASVYINRVKNPTPETVGLLNADPTLQYGLATLELRPEGHPALAETEGAFLPVDLWGSVKWWPMLQVGGAEVDLLLPSLAPYQTYVNPGMPPTPIAVARIESLQAVATAPLDQGLYFFVAGCPNGVRDGSHYFAGGLGDHNANVARATTECAGL